MDNYNEIMDKENTMNRKESLVHDAINAGKLSQYEIIARMFEGLVNEIEELKKILFQDLAVTNKSKEKAEKISKIAFTLQTCLDLESNNQIATDLNYLYRYIRYMSKRIQDNNDMNMVQPAFSIASQLKEAWDSIPVEERKV
jgi:flagellin-specific chaperone FliS|tara:strand:- start:17380 stop:17805 length:426 start_codon:yes stop_codon:yes gene_type:complete